MNFNVYFKTLDGNLGMHKADGYEDPANAILDVKEALVASREGYNEPVLAVIKGGKE